MVTVILAFVFGAGLGLAFGFGLGAERVIRNVNRELDNIAEEATEPAKPKIDPILLRPGEVIE